MIINLMTEDDIWCFYFPFYALPVLSILLDQKCSIWRVLGCSKLIFVLDRLTKKPPIESSIHQIYSTGGGYSHFITLYSQR